MNPRDVFERAAELERARTPFALATVVGRDAPVSAHLGDRAIVLSDGRMRGFVGGSCARDIVRRQAVEAIAKRSARLVQIRSAQSGGFRPDERTDAIVVPMSCASEGSVDVYIEPHLPARTLLVVGMTPVADALSRFGSLLEGYRVLRVVEGDELQDLRTEQLASALELGALPEFLAAMEPADRAALVAVVASQGHYDEASLEALLAGDSPAYVGLLASRKRAANVFGILQGRGVSRESLATVHNPAGLDIGARQPAEVAVSILAEIIEAAAAPQAATPYEPPHELAVDLVCGMDVEPARSAASAQYAGRLFYFCSAHCKATFQSDPARYALAVHA
jgi:xanthine dehydrogenase accessory factor